jgi:hypothetical protein
MAHWLVQATLPSGGCMSFSPTVTSSKAGRFLITATGSKPVMTSCYGCLVTMEEWSGSARSLARWRMSSAATLTPTGPVVRMLRRCGCAYRCA